MIFTDQRDLALTVADSRAVEIFDEAVEAVVRFRGDPVAILDRALEIDDRFVLAHCLSAMMNTIGNASSRLEAARLSIDRARGAVKGAQERERLHVAAVEAWFDSNLDRASRIYQQILFDHPRDLMALFAGHWLDFYRGDAPGRYGRVARVLSDWDESVPGHHWLLGMYAFGLEEVGQFRRAEFCGRRAVECDPGDAWGVHAVAHVMEMEGRLEEGVAWLEATRDGWASTNMKIHNWWHELLFRIDLSEFERALQIYDEHVVDPERDDVEALIDRVSAMARLSLLGIDVGNRWQVLAPLWVPLTVDARNPFNDLHALLCFRFAGEDESAVRLMRAVEKNYDVAIPMMATGLSVLAGVDAFCTGHNAGALERLIPVFYEVYRIGGSHAQRDLVQQIVLEAAIRGRQWTIARALLAERLRLRETAPHAFTTQVDRRLKSV